MANQQKQPIQPNEQVFNDQNKADDALNSIKKLLELYNTFSIEAGSDQLHKEICNLKEETSNIQRSLFNTLYAKGWYPVTPEDQSKITQAYTKYSNMASQLK